MKVSIYNKRLPLYLKVCIYYKRLPLYLKVYIGLYWLIIGQIIDNVLVGFTKNGVATNQLHMTPNQIIIAAKWPWFRSWTLIFSKYLARFGRPGPARPQGPDLGPKFIQKSENLHRIGLKWPQLGFYQYGSLNYILNNLFGLIFYYMGPYFNYFT